MKKLSVKIIGVLIVILMICQSSVVMAASSINEMKEDQSNNRNEINKIQKDKKEIGEEKAKISSEIDNLTTEIVNYETQIGELDNKINNLNGQINSLNADLEKSQAEYTQKEDLLEKRLVAIQEAGETSYLDFILSSDSLVNLISNFYLVSEIASYDEEILDGISKQKEKIESGKRELEDKKKEIDTTKSTKQSASMKLKVAKGEKDKKVANLSEEEKKMQEKIDQLIKDNNAIDAKIQKAQKAIEDAKRKNNKNNGKNNGGGTSSPSASGFIYPVPKNYSRITTGLYYSTGKYHGAVDFGSGGIEGQPVYAVADGYVVTSERLKGSYGNYIVIAHYNGLYTLYAHGQDGSRTVKEGDTVRQGQQIMRVGTTGNSSGPHLHFEVRKSPGKYANRVNPAPYLP